MSLAALHRVELSVAIGGAADVDGLAASRVSVENDPKPTPTTLAGCAMAHIPAD
jgi:hypothetical protein